MNIMNKYRGRYGAVILGLMSAIMISACHAVGSKGKYNDIEDTGIYNTAQSHETENNDMIMETDSESYDYEGDSTHNENESQQSAGGQTATEYTAPEHMDGKEYNNTHKSIGSSMSSKAAVTTRTSETSQSASSVDNNATKAYLVRTEVRKVVNSYEKIKYGATRKNITEYTYEIYSDDSRKEVAHASSVVIDRSTYSATDDILKEEAEYNSVSYADLWNEILQCVNRFRADNNIAAIVLDNDLCKAACMRAVEIDYSAYFSHIRPDGRSAFTALDYYGCVTGFRGENLAGGQRTPELVVKAWEESDKGHRELLLNPKVKKMGCGYSYSGTIGYPVWALEMTD